jgi:hypothetical protein
MFGSITIINVNYALFTINEKVNNLEQGLTQ